MNRYTYEYRVFEDASDDYYHYSCLSHQNMPHERIAEGCAEDYYSEHDGWECTWPRNFEIRLKGELLGCFECSPIAKFEAVRKEP